MDQIASYVVLGYAVCSGLALISAGCAKAFPQVPFFATATNVLGVVALDVQKFAGFFGRKP